MNNYGYGSFEDKVVLEDGKSCKDCQYCSEPIYGEHCGGCISDAPNYKERDHIPDGSKMVGGEKKE